MEEISVIEKLQKEKEQYGHDKYQKGYKDAFMSFFNNPHLNLGLEFSQDKEMLIMSIIHDELGEVFSAWSEDFNETDLLYEFYNRLIKEFIEKCRKAKQE